MKDEAWKQDLWSSKNKSQNGIGHAIFEIGLVEEEEEEEEDGEIDCSYKLLFYNRSFFFLIFCSYQFSPNYNYCLICCS